MEFTISAETQDTLNFAGAVMISKHFGAYECFAAYSDERGVDVYEELRMHDGTDWPLFLSVESAKKALAPFWKGCVFIDD